MLKNSKIKIVNIVPRLQARLVSVMPSYSMPKIVNVKANSVGHGIKPTFTRVSTAYKSDGTQVAAGVPRIEVGKGTLVEEVVSNLFGATARNSANWITRNGGVISNDGGVEYVSGIPCVKIVAPGVVVGEGGVTPAIDITPSATYTQTIWLKGSGRVRMQFTQRNASDANIGEQNLFFNLTNDWKPYTITQTFLATAAKTKSFIFTADSIQATTFYIGAMQLEQKAYATTFHPTTRTAESLTVPASALSASEGTIEFDVDFSAIANLGTLFAHYTGTNANRFTSYKVSNKLYFMTYNSAGVETSASYDLAIISSGIKRGAFRWSNSAISVWIAGAKVKEVLSPNLPTAFSSLFFLGCNHARSVQINTYISNLRISNKARTDTELANVGALSVDEYTTYFAPMTRDLTAYTKGNGNATLKSISC